MDSPSGLFLLPDDDYDRQVVSEGNDVCQRLNLPEHVRRIVWLHRILWHTLDSDYCYFKGRQAIFPSSMKGRLEPREWRPLIASYKMYRYVLRSGSGRFLITLPIIFLTLIAAGLIARILGTDVGMTLGVLFLVIDIPVLFNGYTQGRKRQRLQADVLAARAEGKEEFLSVLRKIQVFGPADVLLTERKQFRRHFPADLA